MKLTRTLAAAGIAGTLAVTGLGAVVVAPLASAATQSPAAATTDDATGDAATGDAARPGAADRVQALKDALAGLVGDGSLTQQQADEVATTLSESGALRGGHGRGGGLDLAAAADALGLTSDELRTALAVDGTTLADVAQAQGVEVSALTDALVAAGTERVQAALAAGRLTQAQADERLAALPEKVAERLTQELPAGGGRGAADGPGRAAATEDGTPDAAGGA